VSFVVKWDGCSAGFSYTLFNCYQAEEPSVMAAAVQFPVGVFYSSGLVRHIWGTACCVQGSVGPLSLGRGKGREAEDIPALAGDAGDFRLRSILILSFHTSLSLPNTVFFSGFPTKILHAFFMCTTCRSYLIYLIIFGEVKWNEKLKLCTEIDWLQNYILFNLLFLLTWPQTFEG
jgi:hypothetical protein